jgi:hypothetical protein
MKSLFLACLLACVAVAAPPKKAVPLTVDGNTVMVVKSFPVMVKAPPGKGLFLWTFPDAVKADSDPEADNVLVVKSAPKVTYTIRVIHIRYDKAADEFVKDKGETVLVIGDGGTPPPPDPKPDVEPDPKPDVKGDLRVLITYESEELPKLPLSEQLIYRGPAVRDALKAKCGPDKSTMDGKAYWILDKDSDVSRLPKFWQDAMKRPRTSPFFIHVFKGEKPVHEAVAPKTDKEVVDLINKWGLK